MDWQPIKDSARALWAESDKTRVAAAAFLLGFALGALIF